MKRVAYYKGCLASLSAKELDISTQALAPKVGLELVELESVTCCGAGDIHEAEPDYYLHLNARILAYAEATGCDTLMTVCNVCTLNLRQANYPAAERRGPARAREREPRRRSASRAYRGTVDVKHFLWLVAEGEGYELLKAAAHKGLKGLKIAPFYGCQILRPSKLLGFEDPDRPSSLERIIEACGGEAIDYPAKIKCCGFPIIQAREETALGELIQPIEQAKEAGADAIVTPCPLCHLSLDAWQSKLKKQTGKDFQMPILHLSQLIGVAAGLEESELKFKRHVVSVGADARKLRSLSNAPRRSTRWPAVASLAAAARLRAGSRRAGCGRESLELPLPGLPAELDGLRIAHLSDFHLGLPSRGAVAAERAVDWVVSREPDLVCITGDLLSSPHGEPLLRRLLARLGPAYAVLGNHDCADRPRSVFAAGGAARPGRGRAARRRIAPRRAARPPRPDRRRRSQAVLARDRLSGAPVDQPPICGSCSATFRAWLGARARRVPPRPRRPSARWPDRPALPGRAIPVRASVSPADRGGLPLTPRRRCTSRPASARRSSRSASSRDRR